MEIIKMKRQPLYRPTRSELLILLALGLPITLLTFFNIDRWRGVLIALATIILVALIDRIGLTNRFWRILGRIAIRQKLSVTIVSTVALITSMLCSWYLPPIPLVHDEYSYLFAAETFASGRLTNPTHPLWEHFETFHILSIPTTASKYPPAQALFLAAGKILTGIDISGVWISFAMACAAFCWMLQAWLTQRWAFIGGLIAALHPFMHYPPNNNYWSWTQSFWGGNVAMLGGCLLFGSLPGIHRKPTAGMAIAMGAGILLLANSRPFEGAIVCLPAALYLLIWLRREIKKGPIKFHLIHFILPISLILFCGTAAMASYNHAVTGSFFRMPNQEHEAQYSSAPMFLFQKPNPNISYRNENFTVMYLKWHFKAFQFQQNLIGWLKWRVIWINTIIVFFIGPLGLAMLWLPAAWQRKPVRLASFAIAPLMGIHQLVLATAPHYLAPAACLFLLVVVSCLRQLSVMRIGHQKIGRTFTLSLLMLLPVCILLSLFQRGRLPPMANVYRHNFLHQLEQSDGQHLVIVRYLPSSFSNGFPWVYEWVYNAPDIDNSKVIWAREMAPEQNRNLLEYFKNRKKWLIEIGPETPILKPWPEPAPTPPTFSQ